MLFGRAAELSRVRARVEAAARGESAALGVRGEAGVGECALVGRGEAGIGKSALVDEVTREVLAQPGSTVLRTRGIESESAIPFGGLSDLLRPVLHLLPELPGPQSAALAGALALGPPAAADRFAIAAAALTILPLAAPDGPLLCVVDDAYWLDASSAEALVFA